MNQVPRLPLVDAKVMDVEAPPAAQTYTVPPFLPPETEPQSTALRPLAVAPPLPRDDGDDDDFKWTSGEDCIVIAAQPAIAVYLNPWGHCVIRQEAAGDHDEDKFVTVAPDNVARLIAALAKYVPSGPG